VTNELQDPEVGGDIAENHLIGARFEFHPYLA